MHGNVIADPFGRASLHLIVDQVEGRLNPAAAFIGCPVKSLRRRQPCLARAGNDLQRTILHASGVRCGAVNCNRSTRLIVARRGGRPTRLPALVERLLKKQLRWLAVCRQPNREFGLELGKLGLELVLSRFPRFFFTRQVGIDHAILRVDPVLRVEGRKEDCLQLIVFLLRDRVVFVIMTTSTMD